MVKLCFYYNNLNLNSFYECLFSDLNILLNVLFYKHHKYEKHITNEYFFLLSKSEEKT